MSFQIGDIASRNVIVGVIVIECEGLLLLNAKGLNRKFEEFIASTEQPELLPQKQLHLRA
jgi:hypothetical protein